ncbi:PF08570 domain protein [Leptospira noguchii serovar Panama str. CZ214]|uniref:PF08570 domain protein n=2 Tax=Leptospira noguchii TaxID=28182 RepID=T0FIH4_9LEPT|nr:PF08570 domain protein [Leptospira noguchii serovar Panama str. CZ214]
MAWIYEFYSRTYTWLCFYILLLFNSFTFENKSWKLSTINAGYNHLQIAKMILSYWRYLT